MEGRIIFKGSFGEYFFISLGLFIISFLTFGILFPYYIYWQFKYFVSNMDIELHSKR